MTTNPTTDDVSLVPALPGEMAMRAWAEELVARARAEGVELTGSNGVLTGLVRQVLQTGLEVELADHLGYEPYDQTGRGSGNSRNGSTPNTVVTEIGDVELRMPRDRNGTFTPATVPKHARRLDGVSANVISLYAKGLTTGEIQTHLAELYGTDVSRETISKITDAVVEDMVAWQNRPLDRLYPVLFDRRHRHQGARRPGRQSPGLRGHRREPRRRARRARPVARADRRRGGQAVDDDAHRPAQPRHRRRADRVL
jgi:hypothetical protein